MMMVVVVVVVMMVVVLYGRDSGRWQAVISMSTILVAGEIVWIL